MFHGGWRAFHAKLARRLHGCVVYLDLVHLVSRSLLACKNGRWEEFLGRDVCEKGPFDGGAGNREGLFGVVGGGQTRVGILLAEDAAAILDGAELDGGGLHSLNLGLFQRDQRIDAQRGVGASSRVLREKKKEYAARGRGGLEDWGGFHAKDADHS